MKVSTVNSPSITLADPDTIAKVEKRNADIQ